MSEYDDTDESVPWNHCGSILCQDAVSRSIFIRFDGDSNSEDGVEPFKLLFLDPGMADPNSSPTPGYPMQTAAAVIDAVCGAGVFTPDEQRDFAKNVESLASVDSDNGSPDSGANALFNELLDRGIADWRMIGSRSGISAIGWFDTMIYARRCGDSRTWTVLERGEQGNGECTITDDGSGRSIFVQFLAQYYEDEIDQYEGE